MRFFRRRSSPVLLALLAFAMQAGLLLAQMHTHSRLHTRAEGRAWATSIVALACQSIMRPGCPPVAPHDHREDCPVCCSLAVASAAVMPAAPAVAPEIPLFAALRPVLAVAGLPGTDTVHFQARAPPIA